MPPAPHHVLLLGGHGKIAQLLTPLLLRRGWDVTSVIRTPEQVSTIEGLAAGVEGEKGKLNALVRSLEEVKSEGHAEAVIKEVGADFVVWSAGE
jgi:nucleoside-diphosphate-sugar epimerase